MRASLKTHHESKDELNVEIFCNSSETLNRRTFRKIPTATSTQRFHQLLTVLASISFSLPGTLIIMQCPAQVVICGMVRQLQEQHINPIGLYEDTFYSSVLKLSTNAVLIQTQNHREAEARHSGMGCGFKQFQERLNEWRWRRIGLFTRKQLER